MNDLTILLSVVLASGGVTTLIMSGIKKLYAKIGELPAGLQQIIVGVIAFGVIKLSTILGIPIPLDPSHWTVDVINSILAALTAFGLHNLKKTHS